MDPLPWLPALIRRGMFRSRYGNLSAGAGDIEVLARGVSTDSSNDRYQSSGGAGYRGSDSGFTFASVAKVDSLTTATGLLSGCTAGASGTGGFGFQTLTSGRVRAILGDDTPTIVFSSLHTHVSGDIGKIHTYVGVFNGSTLAFYVNGVLIGTPTAVAGTFFNDTSLRHTLCNYSSGGNPCTGFTVLQAQTSSDILDAGEVESWHNSVASNHPRPPLLTLSEGCWTVLDEDSGVIINSGDDTSGGGSANLGVSSTPVLSEFVAVYA